jgi:hypothetical protein
MRKSSNINYKDLKISLNGKEFIGRWFIDKDTVTVEYWDGDKIKKNTTQVGNSVQNLESLAKLLLKEIV